MPAGIIQLVARGAEDEYLTGDPKITFFKTVYRRHTNFSIESIVQNFETSADFGKTVSCTISKIGDLVGMVNLVIQLPDVPKFEDNISKFSWISNIGYGILDTVSIQIGEIVISELYGEWLYLWSQLDNSDLNGLNKLIGNIPEIYSFTDGKNGYRLTIPLQFWFCRNSGLYLPLISLNEDDIKIRVKFRKLVDCCRIGPSNAIVINDVSVPFKFGDYIYQNINNQKNWGYFMGFDYLTKTIYYHNLNSNGFITNLDQNYNPFTSNTKNDKNVKIFGLDKQYVTPEFTPDFQKQLLPKLTIASAFLMVDYVYLDNEERTKFINNTNSYLIEQVQFNGLTSVTGLTTTQKLVLKYTCKNMIWVAQMENLNGKNSINDRYNYTNSPVHCSRNLSDCFLGEGLIKNSELIINGVERFGVNFREYFELIQPYENSIGSPLQGINSYSFSLYPHEYQPSGSINMSKISESKMVYRFEKTDSNLRIAHYTTNYNILRFFQGNASLMFD